MEQTTAAPLVQDEPVCNGEMESLNNSADSGILATTLVSSCRFCMMQSNFASNRLTPVKLVKTTVDIRVNGCVLKALIDTGSCESYMDEEVAYQLKLSLAPSQKVVYLASTANNVKSLGSTVVQLVLEDHEYKDFKLDVLPIRNCFQTWKSEVIK